MGTGATISYGSKKSTTSSGASSQNLPPMSPYFYGVVTYVDPTSREIQFNTLKNNIGVNKVGNAKPSYKDNITLPEVEDVVPLFIGPSMESSLLGEQDTSTVYYLNPISTLQELNKNSLVRSSNISATPPTVNPTKSDYKLANTGFVKTDNGNVKPSI